MWDSTLGPLNTGRTNSDMDIVIKDSKTGKEYLVRGKTPEWELFQRSKGKIVDGVLKGKGEWVSCRLYPTTLPAAVSKVVNFLLADPDNPDEYVTEAVNAGKEIRKTIDKRIRDIVAEVMDE